MCKPTPGWNVFVDKQFKNDYLIFPTMQLDVSMIVSYAENNTNINKVIIFGSSVTSACNPWSDIDVYYDLVIDEDIVIEDVEAALDKWTNFSVDHGLLDEINKTGVIVFER